MGLIRIGDAVRLISSCNLWNDSIFTIIPQAKFNFWLGMITDWLVQFVTDVLLDRLQSSHLSLPLILTKIGYTGSRKLSI